MIKITAFIIFICNIYAQEILHERVRNIPYLKNVEIHAYLSVDREKIHRFSLLYRPEVNQEYIETPMMIIEGNKYMGIIPKNYIIKPFVEYYILLELSDQREVTFPLTNPKSSPVKIEVDMPKLIVEGVNKDNKLIGIDANYVIISPKPRSIVQKNELFVALSYFKTEDLDSSKIQVLLNNQDITRFVKINSNYLTVPREHIPVGYNSIEVLLTNYFGQIFNPIIWDFMVLSESSGPSIIKQNFGQININYNLYNPDIRKVNYINYGLKYMIDLEWIKIKTNLRLSNLEDKHEQSWDRYSFSFFNDIISLDIGDTYPVINKYGLNGSRIRGLNLNFNQGFIFFSLVNGQSLREVQGNPKNNAITISSFNSIENQITLSRDNYTFEQNVMGLNAGLKFGGKLYFDIDYLKVKDNIESVIKLDETSIIFIPDSIVNTIDPSLYSYFDITDSSFSINYTDYYNFFENIFPNYQSQFLESHWIGNKPQENILYGFNFKINFDQDKMYYKQGLSLSYINYNTWYPVLTMSSLDSINDGIIDGLFMNYIELDTSLDLLPNENVFKYGINQSPFISNNLLLNGSGILNLLNQPSIARYNSLHLNYLGHRIEIGLQSIGPQFFSILNPYLQNNHKVRYFSDYVPLFDDILIFNYKWNITTEGIEKESQNSTRIKSNLIQISLLPGIDLPTFNLGFSYTNRNNELNYLDIYEYTYFDTSGLEIFNLDTIDSRENNITNRFSINMSDQIKYLGIHSYTLSINSSNRKDLLVEHPIQSNNYQPKNYMSNAYSFNINSNYLNKLSTGFSINLNKLNHGTNFQNTYKMYDLNASYKVSNIIKNVTFSTKYLHGEGTIDITQYLLKFSTTCEFIKHLLLTFNYEYRINYLFQSKKSDNNSFIFANMVYKI